MKNKNGLQNASRFPEHHYGPNTNSNEPPSRKTCNGEDSVATQPVKEASAKYIFKDGVFGIIVKR